MYAEFAALPPFGAPQTFIAASVPVSIATMDSMSAVHARNRCTFSHRRRSFDFSSPGPGAGGRVNALRGWLIPSSSVAAPQYACADRRCMPSPSSSSTAE